MSMPGSIPGRHYRRADGSSRRESDMNESAMTALMHLEMIFQAARGEYSPKADELVKRKEAIVAFITTGSCLADDDDRALASKVSEMVNSHFTAAAQPDAA